MFNSKGGGSQRGRSPPGIPGCGAQPPAPTLAPASVTPVPHQDLSWQISSCPSKPVWFFYGCFTTASLLGWVCHFFVFFPEKKNRKKSISL